MIEEIPWDQAVTETARALAAWQKETAPPCGKCGREAPMKLSFDASDGYPYRLAIDWSITEPGWMTVHGEKGERTLFCPACKPKRLVETGNLFRAVPPTIPPPEGRPAG